ncbi:hypothetical protein TBLA_0B05710 [Henningerozyma blattae CBS 6284]|uniref:Dolichyl-phosphate-mannose--protein mannosyltransferase n=1 Tax=Henningerozyma blattae (strain ATCC 34711 / CBS 6284 / DSM 70876 / NBRC 10599 / NRRL Y-10934 / UCD 77-7) TaxID=1071380 RepID=I2GZ46_HENB6|nr:hypothetical protein TBLA_0B05710 [Tetrapisispora blattae CBS 6284]CCH59398.1 hypothetical protein TBLA_0B05710 [Tetrapisispora blattae CBS 6284]
MGVKGKSSHHSNEKAATSNTDVDPVIPFQIEKGPLRPYVVTEPSKELASLRTLTSVKEIIMVAFLTIFAISIRFKDLKWPNAVIFDEVHFGGFAANYINRKYFFDVHPPFAKMLFAWVGALAGFKGQFHFDTIGLKYLPDVPYVFMRGFSATCGLLTILFMYLTLRASGVRMLIALICTMCFTVENSFVTISRYILLDAPLIVFIAATAYSYKKYELYPTHSWRSYKYLLACGLALGMAASSKWVGLFTFAWIGLLCVWKLWFYIGDLQRSVCSTTKVAFMKFGCLLIVPFLFYMMTFYIHFKTLIYDGSGTAFLSSATRTTFIDNTIPKNMIANVGYGSVITLLHAGTRGGYLHSHPHDYETGSKQQQITLYSHLDDNNKWVIESNDEPFVSFKTFENISDGASIRLNHISTHHRLHSHDHPAPVSEHSSWQKEVSGYGYQGFSGDLNDAWIVEIDKDESASGDAQKYVRALETKFRLRHAMTGCYLFSHEVKLPKWGFEQQEVSCAYSGKKSLTLWYIEGNENPVLPEDAERISYKKPSFFKKFLESNYMMWEVNKALTEPHYYQSLPSSWPLLSRGISYWGDHNRIVYLLGNAILWWSSSLFTVLFTLTIVVELIVWQLGKPILQDSHVINFHVQVIHYLLGYALHFIPSFLMGRQMFLHHYLPAYYFAILAFGHALDIIVTYILKKRKNAGLMFTLVFFLSCLYFFNEHSPIIYGTPWTKEMCQKSKWLSTWDYNCDEMLDNLADYEGIDTQVSGVNFHSQNTMDANVVDVHEFQKGAENDERHVLDESMEEAKELI